MQWGHHHHPADLPSGISSWGFGAIFSPDCAFGATTLYSPRGCPSHYSLSEWHLASAAVYQSLFHSLLLLAHSISCPGPSPGPVFWPGSQEPLKSWRNL